MVGEGVGVVGPSKRPDRDSRLRPVDRINGPGAVGNSFVGGNPILGIDGTVVTSTWAQDVQEELCGFIEGEGIGLEPLNRTQLAQAIEAAIVRVTGAELQFTAPVDLVAGDPLLVVDTFGVVVADVLTGATGVLRLRGRFVLPKATGSAWSAGQALYWDAGAGEATTSSGGNRSIGVAAVAASSGATTGSVLLKGPPSM